MLNRFDLWSLSDQYASCNSRRPFLHHGRKPTKGNYSARSCHQYHWPSTWIFINGGIDYLCEGIIHLVHFRVDVVVVVVVVVDDIYCSCCCCSRSIMLMMMLLSLLWLIL
jgi:hypothetical protein